MTPPALEFWFEFASPYSYLSAEEIDDKARAAGVRVLWKPFLLGPIFARQGWTDSPFNLYPAKGAYMWRDMERLCAKKNIPLRRPTTFPRNGLLAARVATAIEDELLSGVFAKAAFRANFVEDQDISAPGVIAQALQSIGLSADEWLDRASREETKALLRRRTEEAVSRGIFGAPSFVAQGELFWGGDRLGDALAWTVSAEREAKEKRRP